LASNQEFAAKVAEALTPPALLAVETVDNTAF